MERVFPKFFDYPIWSSDKADPIKNQKPTNELKTVPVYPKLDTDYSFYRECSSKQRRDVSSYHYLQIFSSRKIYLKAEASLSRDLTFNWHSTPSRALKEYFSYERLIKHSNLNTEQPSYLRWIKWHGRMKDSFTSVVIYIEICFIFSVQFIKTALNIFILIIGQLISCARSHSHIQSKMLPVSPQLYSRHI